MLEHAHDPGYRRTIHHQLSRGERRNALARAVFHSQRGQLRRHYQAGQENQLDILGIVIDIIVPWQTIYIQAAPDHLAANGYPIDPAGRAWSAVIARALAISASSIWSSRPGGGALSGSSYSSRLPGSSSRPGSLGAGVVH